MKERSEATQTLRSGCIKADSQTNMQTDRGDYNTLRSLARSVKITENTRLVIGYAQALAKDIKKLTYMSQECFKMHRIVLCIMNFSATSSAVK